MSNVITQLDTVTITNTIDAFGPGERVLFEPEQFQRVVEERRGLNELLGNVRTLPWKLFIDECSLAQWQTPVRDQGDRGTCFAFAGVAAMEAMYRRQWGVDLDLSEQYLFQIEKLIEVYGDYTTRPEGAHESNCSFWGAQGSSDILLHASRAALPTEALAPYRSQGQLDAIRSANPAIGVLDWNCTQEQIDLFEFDPTNVSVGARRNARYRVEGWAQLPDVTTSTLENSIRAGHEVVLDITVMWKSVPDTVVLQYDPASGGGGHCVLVVGYNRTFKYFEIKNSWGGNALTKVSYEFIEKCALGGTYITSVTDPNGPVQTKAWWLGRWSMDHDGWRGDLHLRRFTDYRNGNPDAPAKLGDYRGQDGQWHDVNGYFVDGGQGIVFTIAPTAPPHQPGVLDGQEFRMWNYSWDDSMAAGYTTWNGTRYGALMSRQPTPGGGNRSFDANAWRGSWAMNHDGWRGTLVVTATTWLPIPGTITLLSGVYTDANGATHAVDGVAPTGTNAAAITIHFPGNAQRFELYGFTWEANVFAGTTSWGGRTFGVAGFRI